MRDDILTIRIRVRDACGTYAARVLAPGPKAQASCTSGPEQAAMACATKVLLQEGIQVQEAPSKDRWVWEFVYSGFNRNPKPATP